MCINRFLSLFSSRGPYKKRLPPPSFRGSLQSGISLIEMAIVLIIIALLTAGVFKGRSLIAQSNLRKTVTQIQNLHTAFDTFHMTYHHTLDPQGVGKRIWKQLYENQLIPKPSENGYPSTPLGGYFFIVSEVNQRTGFWLALGRLQEAAVEPLITHAQGCFLRDALGYDPSDPDFVLTGQEGCNGPRDAESHKRKCTVYLFLCE